MFNRILICEFNVLLILKEIKMSITPKLRNYVLYAAISAVATGSAVKASPFLSEELFSATENCSETHNMIMKPVSASQSSLSFSDLLIEQNKKLRHVEESEKNSYAKSVLSQKNPYNIQAELNSFIKKLRYDDGFLFRNETNESIKIKFKVESKNNPGFFKTEKINILPDSYFIYDKKGEYGSDGELILNSAKIIYDTANNNNIFLNPKFTDDGIIQLNIENKQDKFFFHQRQDFDFTSKKFTPEQMNDQNIPADERQFMNDFNGSADYMDYAAKQEGTSLEKMDQQRRDLYEKNNMGSLLKADPDLLDSTTYKIPLVTHKIWVTSDDAPKNPSLQYIKWLENSIEHNPLSDGWTHYFWIESKEKLPELTKLLENHPTIKLMELKDLDTSTFVTGDTYLKAIKNKKFGKASDIIRLELLRQFGGFYLDTDYELFQSLAPYSKAYDMMMGLEPMSVYLCNAFMGARPDHPVVNKALEMIQRNLSENAPDYIKNAPDNGFKTIIETGPALVTTAFNLAAGQGDDVDIIMPPQIMYPATDNVYPKKQVVTPEGKKPASAFGAHYWRTAWMDPAFGSNG